MAGLVFAQIQGGERKDVSYGRGINLQKFKGPNVDIVVVGRNMGVVDFIVVDNEHEVTGTQTNIDSVYVSPYAGTATVTGESHVVFHPVTTRKSIHLGNGKPVDGTRAEAYLLHEIPDGPTVYLLDALDTRQNEYALLIVSETKAEKESGQIAERLRRVESLKKDGAISDDEARKKRDEILANL